MRVIFAEKPSMGRAIAAGLGIQGSGKSSIQGKDPGGREVVVTWGIGHLVALAGGFESYNPEMKAWKAEHLPFVPETFKTEVIHETKDQFDAVKKILLNPAVKDVVVATDPAREGELIARYTFDKIGVKAPTFRLWSSSLTEEAIRDAYGKMKPWSAYKPLQDSALCRSEADWLVGLNGTRALTIMARLNGRPEKGSWAVGRVMTPTLAILVKRELEIQNFKSKPYWTLEAIFGAAEGNYKGKWFSEETDSFATPEAAKAIQAKIQGKPGTVVKVDTRETRKRPEAFYDLTELQEEANKRFGISAKDTLDTAQELYEKKVLSYPRTNSKHLTHADEAKIPSWLGAVGSLADYSPFVAEITKGGKPALLGPRYVDDGEVEDHGALVPTEKAADLASLTDRQRKVYDMVVRRFLAAWFSDLVEAKTTIITAVEGETFKTYGTVILDPGWTRVDVPSSKKPKKKGKKKADDEGDEDEAQEGKALPRVSQQETVKLENLLFCEKKTEPPKRLTEADLLSAMKTAGKDLDDDELKEAMKAAGVTGIGTPATRAATIEKLLSRGTAKYPKDPLVERKGKALIPTQRGIDLIQILPDPSLKSPELTGRWEASMEDIRKEGSSRKDFMAKIADYTKALVESMLGDTRIGGATPSPQGFEPKTMPTPCPKCGSTVVLKAWDGKFYTKCSGKDCYFGYEADRDGESISPCPHCEGGRLRSTPKGRVCADCGEWEKPKSAGSGKGPAARTKGAAPKTSPTSSPASSSAAEKCPKCKAGTLAVRKGQFGYFVSCSDRACGLIFGSDANGKAEGGACSACKGPVKKTKSGSRVCAVCGTWQDPK